MASHFFLVFLVVILTVVDGTLAEDNDKPQPVVDRKSSTADNTTKSLIDSLGPSQDYPDYEIPKELAPDGVEVVGDYVPISPTGGQGDPLAQPEADMNAKTSPSGSASRSSSTVLAVVVAGGASLFLF
ncbi:hypothetical protein EUTSA_v10005128mg [Eutrema salsugineum]|uniref:Uncharacterized protein n=1 Tax=Eutrema salsugineum TaxID=72664 RepID=V4KRU0_EUTSA|nr:uncharacterized protein LOC18013426 [Eutrema salsugineum]ESQ32732.1 hypothetical protein EUTSA_v10005128mg [Eutrema salsugineum]